MKRVAILLSLALGIWMHANCGLAGQWEVQQAFDYYLPEDAFWDQAYGGGMTLVYWQQPALGVAFAAGLSQWESTGERATLVSNPGTFEQFQAWEGDVQYITLGASVLLREYYTSRNLGECQLTLEAGCRYVRCNSDLELVRTERVWLNPGQIQEVVTDYVVDCDDGIVGRVAASLAIRVNDQSSLFVAGGYQFDIDTGNVTVDSLGQSTPLDLSAFFARVGLAIFLK